MKSLDNKDLERFAWEKMAPRIEEKIKKKRRSFFFLWIFGVGLIFLVLGTGIYITTDNEIVTYSDGFSKKSNEFPAQMNNSSNSQNLEQKTNTSKNELGPIDLDYTNKEGNIVHNEHDNSPPASIEFVLEESQTNTNTKANIDISNSKGSNFPSVENSQNVKINTVNVVSIQNAISKEVKNGVGIDLDDSLVEEVVDEIAENMANVVEQSNLVPDRASSAVRISNNQALFVEEEIEMNEIVVFENDPIVLLETSKLETKDIIKSSFFPIVHINTQNGRLKNAVELSFNSNTLRKHPHTPQIGTGYTLGYWAYTTKKQYVGFEYSFQEVRYQFVYPPEFGGPNVQKISNNKHKLYNIPIFYGYQFQKFRTQLSIETGVNLTILRISEGDINSVTNSSAIFKIENENYFRQEVGASFLLRAKVDYSLGLNYGLFARVGTNISVTNWYKNDSYQIKPIIMTLDIGLRRSF